MGKQWKCWETLFSWLQNHCRGWLQHKIKRYLLLGRKTKTNLDRIFKNRDITLRKKSLCRKSYNFSSSHIWMWELDYTERWALKNWWFWSVVLEKTLVISLDSKGIKLVSKKFSTEYLLEGLTVKLKLQYFGHLMQRTDSCKWPQYWERLKAEGGQDDRGWDLVNHQLNGDEFEQAMEVGDGQRSLVCHSSWGCK